jgi:hypothetical protein
LSCFLFIPPPFFGLFCFTCFFTRPHQPGALKTQQIKNTDGNRWPFSPFFFSLCIHTLTWPRVV